MKRTAMIIAVLGVWAEIGLVGCHNKEPPGQGALRKASATEEQALKEVSEQTGMVFPSKALLIHATDGGGRDTSKDFYAWGIFSPTPISMPEMITPNKYLMLPLEDTVIFVQGMIRDRKILQPKSALGSHWETENNRFRGTLISTEQGDYLVIEQFRRAENIMGDEITH